MRVLVVNAGSSSLKLRVVEQDNQISTTADLGPPGPDLGDMLADFVAGAGTLDAAGHRVVHGGPSFSEAVVINHETREAIEAASDLAPLHNPPALAAIDALSRLRPGLASAACFDTAFHAGLPAQASTYALPSEWVNRWGIRRYGFHGLSCTWAVTKTAELLGWPLRTHRIVVCHLGAGASATAVSDGRSLDTTMGFTPLEGLVMATRPGDVDPGALCWLIRHGIELDDLDDTLEHRSGLAALAEGSGGDMRALLDQLRDGSTSADLALGVYLHRLRAKVASMAAAMEGLDALVFTGGVGEGSPTVRAEACARLGWLGVELDEHANTAAVGCDANISATSSPVQTLVVRAREDLVIAADCRRLFAGRP